MKKWIVILFILFSFLNGKGQDFDYLISFEEDTSLLSGIYRDNNLILKAYFPDCGEFGGHDEIIIVKKINQKLIATITIYDKVCYDSVDSLKIISQIETDLDTNKVKLIYKYLSLQMNESLQAELFHHANSEYHSYFTLREEQSPLFKRLELICRNSEKIRIEFEKLKVELMK